MRHACPWEPRDTRAGGRQIQHNKYTPLILSFGDQRGVFIVLLAPPAQRSISRLVWVKNGYIAPTTTAALTP